MIYNQLLFILTVSTCIIYKTIYSYWGFCIYVGFIAAINTNWRHCAYTHDCSRAINRLNIFSEQCMSGQKDIKCQIMYTLHRWNIQYTYMHIYKLALSLFNKQNNLEAIVSKFETRFCKWIHLALDRISTGYHYMKPTNDKSVFN